MTTGRCGVGLPGVLPLEQRLGCGRTRPAAAKAQGVVRSCRRHGTPMLRTWPRFVQRSRFQPCAQERPEQETPVKYNTEFGYSRKDVIIICLGVAVAGYAVYYGFQAAGVDALVAGPWTSAVVVAGLLFGWVSTYFFRVATKDMTYAKQLRDYEEGVMQKRFESLTDSEVADLMQEIEQEKQKKESP
ncbi:unnamed protein product [Ostreobium quekettii]|uniref:Uncharacterized protein n=1 Tax=Ostreobium quekettii TaxID=121088 RepID=A0A8S1J044_9CHLO|nr:unnamed protein product [Ostreobium quekettii]